MCPVPSFHSIASRNSRVQSTPEGYRSRVLLTLRRRPKGSTVAALRQSVLARGGRAAQSLLRLCYPLRRRRQPVPTLVQVAYSITCLRAGPASQAVAARFDASLRAATPTHAAAPVRRKSRKFWRRQSFRTSEVNFRPSPCSRPTALAVGVRPCNRGCAAARGK
jgi:hypothetical protein